MSETDTRVTAPAQELVVRVIVEQPGGGKSESDTPPNTTIADLAAIVLRLSEVVERLAVVEEGDAAIVAQIKSFHGRITALEKALEGKEVSPPPEVPTEQPIGPDALAALEERLAARVAEMVANALANSAFMATDSTSKPPIRQLPTVAATAKAQPAVADEPQPPVTPTPPSAPEHEQPASDIPDYMIIDERLPPNAERAERIILFLLSQPGQCYISPNNTAGKDIREILEIESAGDFSNTLAHLKDRGSVWSRNKNSRRIIALGLNEARLKGRQHDGFYTERLERKVSETEFSEGSAHL